MSKSNSQVSFDSILEALRSQRRRQLLIHVLEKNPREEAKQVDELDFDGDEEEFLVQLHHVDLPKLDEMGFISWDRETGKIVKGPQFDEIRPLLEMLRRHDDALPDGWL